MKIKKIPLRDQILLSASVCINNYKRAVEELVYNSLDAESTSIAVRVNIEENFIQILDNGSGIEKCNFTLLGKKYSTSKFVDITTLKSASNKYGYRGLSLASIIEISQTVKISSKIDNTKETWLKSFYKGKEKKITLHNNRPSKGTTVEVTGFLYNLKIQKKSTDSVKELQNIKLYLQQLSLMHCNVSISLRDDSKNEIIFTVNKNRDIYQTLRTLFNIQPNDLYDLQVEKKEYKVKGYMGKNKDNIKKCQWIYLNGIIINKSVLHKKVNTMINKTFTITGCGNKKNKILPADENYLFNNNLPYYFIFISCPKLDVDVIYKNNDKAVVEFKNWQEIEKLLEKLIKFYSGDLTLKPMDQKQDSSVKQNKKCSETRKKVKEIMEKILNNHTSKPKISQLKKGIKGKNVKRKKEPKVKVQDMTNIKMSIDKINLPKKTIDLSKIIDPKNKITCNNENIFKEPIMVNKHLNATKKKNFGYKTPKQKKPSLNKAKDIDVMNKCRRTLCRHKSKALNHKKHKKLVEYKNLDSDYSQRKKYIATDYKKQNDILRNNHFNINNFEVKTSYDLLNPAKIIQPFTPLKERHLFLQETQSYVATCESCFPKTTFNSHNFNQVIGQKKNVMRQFISSNSCNNFLLNEKSIRKRKLTHKSNNIKKFKNALTLTKNVLSQNKLTPTINEAEENRDKITMCDINESSNTRSINFQEQYTSQNFASNKKYSYSIDINYENTYSINMLSSSIFTYNSNYNKTYSLQTCKNFSFRNKSVHSLTFLTNKKTYNSIVKNNLNNNIIVSESQTLEPLNFCETVFQTDEWSDFDKEFYTSFLNNNEIGNMDQLKSINKAITDRESINNSKLNDQLKENDKIIIDSHMSDQVLTEIGKDSNNVDKEITHCQMVESKAKSNLISVECNDINNFKLKGRHSFVPKGMSQIFQNNYKIEYTVDNIQEYYEDDIYTKFAEDVLNNIKIFEPAIENVKDVVSKDLKKVNDRLDKDNADLIFDCSSLQNVEVLGQMDTKFILAIIKGKASSGELLNFLALFDQHAVDERLRLESNLKDYFNGNEWASVQIDSVINVKLSQEDYFYVYNHKEKFIQFGLQWTFANNEILIHAIPTAILGKNLREVEIVMKAVQSLISELIEEIKTLKGNVTSYPKSIMKLICSEACRYSIKFGDKLSKNDCINLINGLSTCKTPFQCAHGRPVMAILTELINNNVNYKVNLNKLKEFKNMTILQEKNKIIK